MIRWKVSWIWKEWVIKWFSYARISCQDHNNQCWCISAISFSVYFSYFEMKRRLSLSLILQASTNAKGCQSLPKLGRSVWTLCGRTNIDCLWHPSSGDWYWLMITMYIDFMTPKGHFCSSFRCPPPAGESNLGAFLTASAIKEPLIYQRKCPLCNSTSGYKRLCCTVEWQVKHTLRTDFGSWGAGVVFSSSS